jgi:hypothetical protein
MISPTVFFILLVALLIYYCILIHRDNKHQKLIDEIWTRHHVEMYKGLMEQNNELRKLYKEIMKKV